MISRYLGNKQSIMSPILRVIGDYAQAGDHVVDAFSGSLSVSMGLKAAGYQVTANDINLFSSVLGEAYLVPTELPAFDVSAAIPSSSRSALRSAAMSRAAEILRDPAYRPIASELVERKLTDLIVILEYLNEADSSILPAAFSRSDFFDAYCEEGARSRFTSSRGSTGNRRFFTPSNAARIDAVLNHLRYWNQQGALKGAALAILLAATLRSIEKIANTQGTFHDFPRSGWDSRALHKLELQVPDLRMIYAGTELHRVGREQDTLDFIRSVDRHSVLYLDPPYNFRQYSAYYFLLNVVCRYVDLDDPDAYFGKLTFVRGQNPDDDFSSSFCKASRFIDDMRTLIQRADCDAVVISYFDGRNHWNKFDSEPNQAGQVLLEQLLSESMFQEGTQATVTVQRRNYASYGGYTARDVSELVLSARLVQDEKRDPRGNLRNAVPQLV